MTQDISSLMDGELGGPEADRALRACCGDEDRMRTWYLYHAIGESMRGRAPATLAVPTAVVEKLQSQPTVLAPRGRMPVSITRVALAAAASVATVGVVGWIGSQGGSPAPVPAIAKSTASSALQPVASTATLVPAPALPALNVQEYLVAHRQVPSPDLYRPVTNTTPAPAR